MTPQPRPAERELFPGVYFTPPPTSTPRSASLPTTDVQDLSLEELRAQHAALLSSIAKLRASNTEMRRFDPHRQDTDLVQAVGENIEIIARRLAKAHQLQNRIDELCPTSCQKEAPQDQRQAQDEAPEQGDGGMFL